MNLITDSVLDECTTSAAEKAFENLKDRVLGKNCGSTDFTVLSLEADDYLSTDIQPQRLHERLFFVRRSRYEDVRDVVGSLFNCCIVYDVFSSIFVNLKPEAAAAVNMLMQENYLIVPFQNTEQFAMYTGKIRSRGLNSRAYGCNRETGWHKGVEAADLFLNGRAVSSSDPALQGVRPAGSYRYSSSLLLYSPVQQRLHSFEQDAAAAAAGRILREETGLGGVRDEAEALLH